MKNQPPEVNLPLTSSDRRPNDHPYYIDECCPNCNAILVYDDLLDGEEDWDNFFFDEFSCPNCEDGCYMDWTPEQMEEIKEAIVQIEKGEGKTCTLKELWNSLDDNELE